jgi:hypothetical protein
MEVILQLHKHFRYCNENKCDKNLNDKDVKTISLTDKEER